MTGFLIAGIITVGVLIMTYIGINILTDIWFCIIYPFDINHQSIMLPEQHLMLSNSDGEDNVDNNS